MRHKHSRVSDPNEFKTNSGDPIKVMYGSKFKSDGTISLFEVSRVNIQDEINSHACETDMSIIINKLRYGDTSVLSSRQPLYGDFTQFPKTFAEAFSLVQRSEDAFNSLPVDIKQAYDNDRAKWFADIGTEKWLSLMGLSSPVKSTVDEVKGDG